MSTYPGITRALFLIVLDNGGLHRDRPEKEVRSDIARWLSQQPQDLLPAIDAWLAGLSDEDLELVCAGEASEADAFMASAGAPPFTSDLLNRYFDEVC
ncbi:hypothetical protein [Azorhizobium doebereinerae]|uniref:hypothetical protein n=1 Tax=Azorhizobium doebereinerae TaxID=281091 RepID=UPI0003FB03FE|nr:hypothetical protein [Azorhizobium doebereinerae]